MDINKCPNCQKQFDQDKRLSKQLPCGCFSCLKCLKNVYQFIKRIECVKHQQVYNRNPEELQDYIMQKQVPQQELQYQEKSVYKMQIKECFRWLQGQYVQKQDYYLMLREVFQDSVKFMKHIQQLAKNLIFKTLIEQFSMSNVKIKNLIKRLSELQASNDVYQQQQQTLIIGQQDPRLSQNNYGQLKQQFQQILSEIEEFKKEQQMDIQSLRVNVQRCMFNMFVYLSDNSSSHLLTESKAETLVQKYFKQFKVLKGLTQVSSQVVNSSFQYQSNFQQLIQESQNSNQQQQSQVIDSQQGRVIVQVKQLAIPLEIAQQDQLVIDEKVMFEQLEQRLVNLQNDFSAINQVQYLCQEQGILLKCVINDFNGLTFGNLLQFLNQIKEVNMNIQVLQFSPLNESGLIEQVKVLQQLSTVTDQQICLKLFQILNLSKNQPKIQQAAANTVTMLNFMNFQFNNIDLSNLDLSNSDLSDTTFTDCNFSNSNLSQANLRNSKFINCDFTSSNLTSIITEHPHIFTGHLYSVMAVAISNDSEFIVSGSLDNMVRLWDVKTGTSKIMRGHTNQVYAVAISSDAEFIVSGSLDKTVRLWNIKTGTSKTMSDHTDQVYAVAISSDQEFIVSGSYDCTIILWDVKTGTSKTMSGHTDYVFAVAISPDSEFIVSGSGDNTVRLWNTKSQQCEKVLSGHTSWVVSVSISNDQQYIVSGSWDSTIRL